MPKWTLNTETISTKRDRRREKNDKEMRQTWIVQQNKNCINKKVRKNPITTFYSNTFLQRIHDMSLPFTQIHVICVTMRCDAIQCLFNFLDMNCCFALYCKCALFSFQFNWKLFLPFRNNYSHFCASQAMVSISRSQNNCVDIVRLWEQCVTKRLARSILLLIECSEFIVE